MHHRIFVSNAHMYLTYSICQYGVCLFLVFILEVAAAIAAFVMQSQVREMLVRTMNEALVAYEKDTTVAAGVDFMQTGVSMLQDL